MLYLYLFSAAELSSFSEYVNREGVRAGKGKAYMLREKAQLSRSNTHVGWPMG